MKQIGLVLLALGWAATVSHAQTPAPVPNGSLDAWRARGAVVLAPVGWLTNDDLFAAVGAPLVTGAVTRSTQAGGTYAAQVANVSTVVGVVPGVLFLGAAVQANSGYDILGGVAYTSRPAQLVFSYQLTGTNAARDLATVQVQLTRTASSTRAIVAAATQQLPASAGFTQVVLPLTYTTAGRNTVPDTLRISFSSASVANPTVGTVLTVDNVAVAGLVPTAARDAAAEAALTVYPTASADGRFTLAAASQPALLRGPLRVLDATGRVVLRQDTLPTAAPTRPLDLHTLPAGLYLLHLETTAGPLVRRLIRL